MARHWDSSADDNLLEMYLNDNGKDMIARNLMCTWNAIERRLRKIVTAERYEYVRSRFFRADRTGRQFSDRENRLLRLARTTKASRCGFNPHDVQQVAKYLAPILRRSVKEIADFVYNRKGKFKL